MAPFCRSCFVSFQKHTPGSVLIAVGQRQLFLEGPSRYAFGKTFFHGLHHVLIRRLRLLPFYRCFTAETIFYRYFAAG